MSRIRDIANILSGVSTDMATDAELNAHAAAADPHTGYVLESLFDAKGDLLVGTADNTLIRQAVGSNNQVLMADSAQTDGVKWANEATATLTTTGDLLYASGANTPARLGIGSNGTYLTSNGSVPSWGTISAGGMTLLSSSVGVSGTTSINFNSISQNYNNLVIYISDMKLAAGGSLSMRLNNDATNANYYYNTIYWSTTGTFGQTSAVPNLTLPGSISTQAGRNSFGMEIIITRYSSASSENTQYSWKASYTALGYIGVGTWSANSSSASNTAVNSVNFTTTQNITDGNFYLYGVN